MPAHMPGRQGRQAREPHGHLGSASSPVLSPPGSTRVGVPATTLHPPSPVSRRHGCLACVHRQVLALLPAFHHVNRQESNPPRGKGGEGNPAMKAGEGSPCPQPPQMEAKQCHVAGRLGSSVWQVPAGAALWNRPACLGRSPLPSSRKAFIAGSHVGQARQPWGRSRSCCRLTWEAGRHLSSVCPYFNQGIGMLREMPA